MSQLIDLLNDRFGTELGDADQAWFDRQVEAAAGDPELRKIAGQNTEEQFGYVFDRQFEGVSCDRHGADDDLFRMFSDKPEFRDALTAWARCEMFNKVQDDLGGAA